MRQADRPSTLHFTEHGAGLPIVNLHGWPAEHGQMMAMMEPLFASRPGWRRIYVDLPGMGLSPGPDWLVSHDQMLEAVSDFIGAVVGDQRVVLAGHSYGAALARGLMAQDGSRVGAAFLLSPGRSEDPLEEAGPPTVFSESQEFLDALTEQEREFAGLFRVHSLNVLDTVRRQAMPGVIAADHEFLARCCWTRLQLPGAARPPVLRSGPDLERTAGASRVLTPVALARLVSAWNLRHPRPDRAFPLRRAALAAGCPRRRPGGWRC